MLSHAADTKHLYNICTMLDQRPRRCADIAQMLYKCFVFAGHAAGFHFETYGEISQPCTCSIYGSPPHN